MADIVSVSVSRQCQRLISGFNYNHDILAFPQYMCVEMVEKMGRQLLTYAYATNSWLESLWTGALETPDIVGTYVTASSIIKWALIDVYK